MSKIKKVSIGVPSGKEFIGNKRISDRVYVWAILNSEDMGDGKYIEKCPKRAYDKIGMNYRTFYKKFHRLSVDGYLSDSGGYYKINGIDSKYTRYIYRETLEELLNEKTENIIKIYIEISSIYDTVAKKGQVPFFRYSDICKRLGYYEQRDTRNISKVKGIIERLREMGLIDYVERKTKVGDNYQINCEILGIRKECKGGDKNDRQII